MELMSSASKSQRLIIMDELKKRFSSRAGLIDLEGTFPFENIQNLKESGYTALTVPRKFGGSEISLSELLMLQERIAQGDGATALSIGWHMGIIKNLAEKNSWPEKTYKMLCEQVINGALVNSAASETQTGSPTRGGKPVTSAIKKDDKWIINGRKIFTTMAPVLPARGCSSR